MTLQDKIKQSFRYARSVYAVSLPVTLGAAAAVAADPVTVPACIILKVASMPVILYLFISLKKGRDLYFYINLGFGKNEYYAVPFTSEFIVFIMLTVISGLCGHAIG